MQQYFFIIIIGHYYYLYTYNIYIFFGNSTKGNNTQENWAHPQVCMHNLGFLSISLPPSSSVPFKKSQGGECTTRNIIDFHSCPFSITTRRRTNVRFHSCPFFSFITLTFFHYKKGGRGRILKYMLAKKNYIHLIIIINIKKIKIILLLINNNNT